MMKGNLEGYTTQPPTSMASSPRKTSSAPRPGRDPQGSGRLDRQETASQDQDQVLTCPSFRSNAAGNRRRSCFSPALVVAAVSLPTVAAAAVRAPS